MDPNGNIYKGIEDEVPLEDRARLDGYLHARAEMDEHSRLQMLAEMRQERREREISRSDLPSSEHG